jgi:NADH-quinone oxidoreductase subunit M
MEKPTNNIINFINNYFFYFSEDNPLVIQNSYFYKKLDYKEAIADFLFNRFMLSNSLNLRASSTCGMDSCGLNFSGESLNVYEEVNTLSYLILFIIFIPLVFFLLLFFFDEKQINYIKEFSLFGTLLTIFYSFFLWHNFNYTVPGFQFLHSFGWSEFLNIKYTIGLDGLSLMFFLLTVILMPFCILISWDSVNKKVKEYYMALLLIEFLLLNIFSVLDLVFFYVFFESVLIPMFLLIIVWGSRERKIHAAYQFFIYTLFGSVLMLLAIVYIYFNLKSTDIQIFLTATFPKNIELILWLCFFFPFAVKIPMFPFHIWLPEAHVEAPTAGSVLLAGVLLKLGTYGILRLLLPSFEYANLYFTPLVFTFSIVGIIYSSCTTIRQIDLKKIIAYSSVAHMNFVLIGLFSVNSLAVSGSIFLMLSHGLVSSGLFLCVGMLYDRYHTRLLKYYGGLITYMPLFGFFFMFLSFANIGFPGTSSFVGELLITLGAFSFNIVATLLACIGMITGACYAMWLYNRVVFGQLQVTFLKKFSDINEREFYILTILFIFILITGIYPNPILDTYSLYAISVSN